MAVHEATSATFVPRLLTDEQKQQPFLTISNMAVGPHPPYSPNLLIEITSCFRECNVSYKGVSRISVKFRAYWDTAVGIATRYGLDGPGVQSRLG